MIAIIKGTPIWVYIIFTYVMIIGLRSLKTRKIFFPQIFILPIVLLVLCTKSLLTDDEVNALYFKLYISMGLLGAGLGWLFFSKKKIRVSKSINQIVIPGSPLTLISFLTIFTIKYFFGYVNAVHPIFAQSYGFIEVSINAIITGFFLGKLGYYCYKFIITTRGS